MDEAWQTSKSWKVTYLWHVMDQQQRDSDGGDIVCAAHLQDVSQAHDSWVPCCDVPWTDIVIHTQVEDNMDFWQVGVPWNVEFTLRNIKAHPATLRDFMVTKKCIFHIYSSTN